MNRLLDHIEDHDLRREIETAIVEELSKTEVTVITNSYLEEERQKYILQLSTYQDGELYGAEVIAPIEETYDDHELDMFRLQIQDTLRAMEEALESE
jgi:hypothetical protein